MNHRYLYKGSLVAESKENLSLWRKCYNKEKPHYALRYMTPAEVHDCGFMDKFYDSPTIPQQLIQDLFFVVRKEKIVPIFETFLVHNKGSFQFA